MRRPVFLVSITTSMLLGAAGVDGGPDLQRAKILCDDGFENQRFGSAIDIDDGVVIVGAYFDGISTPQSGAAYLFDLESGEQLFKLVSTDLAAGDYLGVSASIDAGIAIVGASLADAPFVDTGAAYLFDVATGQQLFKLTANDGQANDMFGESVAISGGLAIVGAPGANPRGSNSGAAYVFDVNTGQQISKLTASDGHQQALFGYSVAIGGDYAAVGAPGSDDAYTYNLVTGFQRKYTSTSLFASRFGLSVAIEGTTLVVGNPDEYVNGWAHAGAAYVYNAETGRFSYKFIAEDPAHDDSLGQRVSIESGRILIGSPRDDDAGSAFLIDAATGNHLAKFVPDDREEGDLFGFSVAIQGEDVVATSIYDNEFGSRSGSAYRFDARRCRIADLNLDGAVDTADLGAVVVHLGGDYPAADVNGSGVVNAVDLTVLLEAFGDGCPR
ncbi:MAG: hypothetical protein H6813_03615 [Phycisphaeraceae bacterium]|nr:hypothetical protein [Phycisphaeraceae bacterium]MCB9847035.1 hypothetical protein [Phycisphaeraceae bacterium]